MNLAELERRNAETLRKIREAPGTAQFPQDAYFGFYTADIFECPPFLMFTANDCPRALDILYSRRFEPMSMLIWCRLAPSASFICDIGAHVGVYSLAAAALCPQKPIEAFEPNPYAFTRLRLHKLVNAFRNINENRFGLAHADGTATFSWHKRDTMIIASGGGIGKRPEGTGEQVLAEFRRLDGLPQAASFHGRGLMKIDVEGAEVLAFQGMQRVLQERPDLLLESFSAESCEQITEMLLPLGYRFYRVREQAMTVEPLPRLEPSIIASGDLNMLLTTRPAAEIERLLGAAARPEAAQGGGSLASAFADPDTFAQWRSALASRFGKYRDALEAAPDAERAQATSKLLFAAICAGEAETAQVSMRSLFPDSRTALPLAVAPVEPLADACRRAGTNAHVALPPRGVDLPADASAPAMAYQADAAVYACLPDASLCPGWDHVITREGNVVSDLGYLPIDVGHAHRPQAYLRREGIAMRSSCRCPPKGISVIGPSISCPGSGPGTTPARTSASRCPTASPRSTSTPSPCSTCSRRT
jgi:FkbM family methyltransferase